MHRFFARPFLIVMFGLVALLVPGSASAAEVRQGKSLYFCGIPDRDGHPHYKLGMLRFLSVS
jgi:hypothetical protein